MAQISDIFPGHENVEAYMQDVIKNVLVCTRAANKFPLQDDYEYYSTFKMFRAVVSRAKRDILSILTSVIPGSAVRERFSNMDLDEQFDMLKDINSSIFEYLGNQLDEASGKKKEDTELIAVTKSRMPINTSWNRTSVMGGRSNSVSLLSAKNIPRPQLKFKTKVDNSNSIFEPIIKEKPNSIKPLAITLEKNDDDEQFCHPYECELEKFHPSEEQLQSCTPTPPRPLSETPLMMVETTEALDAMCKELKEVKEFAVDIEHHSYRSFQGFSCLIQISTRDKDYIVDTIELRSELWVLNEVFTDPKITKVLHGADHDVLWLQRDFGLYIVNMFDTGQAARVLSFPHLSLVYLLKHYCKINLDKRFQLADWRIRPLPPELLKYAREDTHHLLYVYDCMKNDLLRKGNENQNLLLSVFQRSKDICLKRYEKPLLREDSYLQLYRKCRKAFNAQQLYCLKELYEWRDKVARAEDESYNYVLPNHMLLQIAEVLPRDHQGILACCNPIPPLVNQQLNELYTLISKASLLPVTQLQEKIELPVMQLGEDTVDLNNILQCPHDIHLYEGRTAHESYISEGRMSITATGLHQVNVPMKTKTSMLIGESADEKHADLGKQAEDIIKSITESHKTAYQRYLLTKKYYSSQSEESQEKGPAAKESNEKSFIEVMNPALKAAFAQDGRSSKVQSTVTTSVQRPASQQRKENSESSSSVPGTSGSHSISSSNPISAVSSSSDNSFDSSTEKRVASKRQSASLPASVQSSTDSSPPKKLKASSEPSVQKSAGEGFQPFNYGSASFSELAKSSGSPKPKNSSFHPKPQQANFKNMNKTPRNAKTHKKQKTLSFHASSNMNKGNRKWPKL